MPTASRAWDSQRPRRNPGPLSVFKAARIPTWRPHDKGGFTDGPLKDYCPAVPQRKNHRRLLSIASILPLIAGVIALAAPSHAASTIAPDDRAAFRALWSKSGAFTPALSAGPEIGWNAGLTNLRPLGANYYRLWDMKVAWRDVNPAPGVFDWSILDQRIAQVESWGGKPIMVLGLTPQWAAADPNAGDPRWGAGTASPPADLETWRAYVRALVQRYGSRIGAYEIWNEANLQTFWTGTPSQMADMVRVATEEIGASSLSLAPSVTTRLKGGPDFTAEMAAAFTPATIDQLDAWSIHTYPAGDAGPTVAQACEQRVDDIIRWQRALVGASRVNPALLKPVWDTEVNYGLAGPGTRPGIDWSDADGAALLQCTYQDSRALGIAVTAWYEFTAAAFDLLGVQMNPQTPQINAAWTQLAETSNVTNPWIPSLGSTSSGSGPVASEQRGNTSITITGQRGSASEGLPSGQTCRSYTEGPPRKELPSTCVRVTGSTTGYPKGTLVTAEYRFPGQSSFSAGIPFTTNADGSFVWYRKTGKKIYVRVVIDGKTSNRVIIPAR